MFANPFNLNLFKLKQYSGDQPITITFYIKNNSIISNRKRVWKIFYQLIKKDFHYYQG